MKTTSREKSFELRRLKRCALVVLCLTAATGCTPVKPWQKKEFSKPQMAVVPTSLESKFRQHIFQSKEGSFGGYGIDGGGCGCN